MMDLALPLMARKMVFLLLMQLPLHQLVALSVAAAAAAETASRTIALPGCPDKCGNISIPYPFGIGHNCFRTYVFDGNRRTFEITCDTSSGEPKAILGTNVKVINISLFPAEVRMLKHIAYNCFDTTGNNVTDTFSAQSRTVMPYRFSYKRNKFTAMGCQTLAYIVGQNGQQFASGCASFCDSLTSPTNDSCSGIGCCQTAIPENVTNFETQWGFSDNPVVNITPCSYAVLVEEDWYNFSTSDLLNFSIRNPNGVPVVLDWAAGDPPCQEAAKDRQNYACRSNNSHCYQSAIGASYLCNCSEGYEGNPYLDGGCTDIDECSRGDQYPCHGNCINIPGNYKCTCPEGTQGDDPKYQNCTKIPDKFPLKERLAVGACAGVTIALALCFITIIELQKRRHAREKATYFNQNGGQILHKEMTQGKSILSAYLQKMIYERQPTTSTMIDSLDLAVAEWFTRGSWRMTGRLPLRSLE